MKLLFDANLSRRIVPMLDDLFPDCVHVSGLGFSGETADKIIWEFARLEGCAIVTADADFIHFAEEHGSPPQIIRLEKMDYSTQLAATLVRRYALAISEFAKSSKSILILKRS